MNLVPLYEEAIQFNNFNGTVLAAGKVEVWYLGRTRKADIYADVAGETPLPNPLDLNDLGMQEVYVNPAFNYTLVVYDPYGSELFSVDKYLQGAGAHTTSNVVVQPSEHIGVSAWTVGEVQIYQPYLTGQLGKVYTGIDPIVVDNIEDKISANHVPLGVQDPLYFVQDDEEGCIIGCSAQTEIPSALSSKWDNAADAVIANSAQWAEGTEYEAGSYVDIDGHTISVTGLSPIPADTASTGLVASVSADITAMIPDTSDMATQTWVNEQGFLTAHQDLSAYAKTEDLTAYQEKGNYYSASNPSGFINSDSISAMATTGFVAGVSADITAMIPDTSDMATKTWVSSQGYLTAHQSLDGLMSADLLEISDNKITGYNGTAFAGQGGGVTGDFTLVEGNGIQLTDDPIAQTTTVSVSGDYATNTQLQTVSADITAMIPTALTGEYVSGNNESGFAIASTAGSIIVGENDYLGSQAIGIAIASTAGSIIVGENDYLGSQAIGIIKSNSGICLSPNQLEIYGNGIDEIINANDISALKQLSSEKADTTALTAYQEITGMTAYATVESLTAKQDAGDYLSASDSANFLLTSDSGNFYPSDNPSAFITGVDLTPYQTTAGMTAYMTTGDSAEFMTTAERSDYIPTGVSSEFYTTANTANYISEVPDTYLQNTDLEISDNKITGISGVPLAAGGELPESVSAATDYVTANSATINGTVETVSSNSGAWGGSALPISAGNGIDLTMINGVLVISVTGGN